MKNDDLNYFTDESLVKMAQEGSSTAEEFLIAKYKETAKIIAKTYFIAGGDNEDVVQEGMIGIFKAIRGFDPEREASFKTFVDLCINRQIMTAINSANRQKHQILNESVSLNDESKDDDSINLFNSLPSGTDTDPESMMLVREIIDFLSANGNNLFSPMEKKVWELILKGKTYKEIAFKLHKTPKTIDNAMQRIKKKISSYMVH